MTIYLSMEKYAQTRGEYITISTVPVRYTPTYVIVPVEIIILVFFFTLLYLFCLLVYLFCCVKISEKQFLYTFYHTETVTIFY